MENKDKDSAPKIEDILPLFSNQTWFPIDELYEQAKELYLQEHYWSCIILCWDIIEMSLRLSFYIESERESSTYTEEKVDKMSAHDLIDDGVNVGYITKSIALKLHKLRKIRNSFTHYRSVVEIGDDEDRYYLKKTWSQIIMKMRDIKSVEEFGLKFNQEFSKHLGLRIRAIAKDSFDTTTQLLLELFPIPK